MRVRLPFEALLFGAALVFTSQGVSALQSSPGANDNGAEPKVASPLRSRSLSVASAHATTAALPVPPDFERRRAGGRAVYLGRREKAAANAVITLALSLIYYAYVSGRVVEEARAQAPGERLPETYKRAFGISPLIMSFEIFLTFLPGLFLVSMLLTEIKRRRLENALRYAG